MLIFSAPFPSSAKALLLLPAPVQKSLVVSVHDCNNFLKCGNSRPVFFRLGLLLIFAVAYVLTGCVSTPPYVYHYIPGQTASVDNGYAVAPGTAPLLVKEAVEAGNELIGKPYRYGGGHRNFYDTAYDCSGAVSFVLHSIGRMNTPTPARNLRSYAEDGPGRWITVYASHQHSFLVIAGLRFDTGYGTGKHGPQWLTRSRPADEFVMRHPYGL
jgi:hypothetical protein